VRDASKRIVKMARYEQEMKGNNGGHMRECETGKGEGLRVSMLDRYK
jgi:hypothetical protein